MTIQFTSGRIFFFALLLLAFNTSAFSQTLTADPVSIDFMKTLYDNYEIEASAVEPITSDLLLVASDKHQYLFLVNPQGKILGTIKLPSGVATLIQQKYGVIPDWEAMAKDSKYFYLINSTGLLLRFDLTDETLPKIRTIQVWELMNAFADIPELNIEGLTVLEQSGKRQLIFGLRQRNQVDVYAIDLSRFSQSLKPEDKSCLFHFDAPSIANLPSELTSIEYIPGWKGYLILTTAEDPPSLGSKLPSHGSYLWFVEDAKIPKSASTSAKPQACNNLSVKPSQPLLLSFNNSTERKAEGLCVLSEDPTSRSARVAIVFDNDPSRTRSATPSGFQLLSITYAPR